MTPSPYTEDSLVQQTTADYLEQQLGWESIYAHNREDFGPDSFLGRRDDREVVLTRTLRAKLVELNPELPDTAYDDGLRQVVTTTTTQTLLATNREKYTLFRDGVLVTFQNEKGERLKHRLRLFDFDEPLNNHFLCVRELWIRGDLYRRRPDIVVFVNGLPLLFMEFKNIGKDIRSGYEKNFKDYTDTIPHIFHHNALLIFGNGHKARLGSITSRWEHFHEWKRLAEREPGVVEMETLLRGLCQKSNVMDLFENFIAFDDSSGDTKKIVARNHQFLGVNRALEAVVERRERKGKLGVFWHTQGSGKSYSMLFFTRKVHRKLGGNFTFLILTDRDDLDTQIYKSFAGCGVVDNDRDPCRASSGQHLCDLLGQHKKYVFSLIQKFNVEVKPEESYTSREDIIVITDEAHRTQYGMLALNMRNALPNASFIGFTGTPLFKDDEITRRVFGDYVSTCDFQRAVDDKATVPIYYDARGEKLGVALGDLNERIAEKLESLEIEDINVSERLETALRRDYHIITAEKRLNQIARDFVYHYSNGWESGKAMMVCIDKITCVRMYLLIEFYWQVRIGELERELPALADEQEEIQRQRKIVWMRETLMAVVVSEEQGEVERFRKWDLDILPHRRLIKEGMELPDSMKTKPRFRNMQRMALDDAFKEEEHPFRVVFVCAMWLTGFDVPSLATIYLDKSLTAHTLIQAIARANRVNAGKINGLIVDYCGILRHLRKALATFAGVGDDGHEGGGGENDPVRADEELLADLVATIGVIRSFLVGRGASLDDLLTKSGFERNAAILAAKEAANENDESRKRFEVMCRELFKKFKACINIEGINGVRADYHAITMVYRSLQEDREQADITDIIRQFHHLVDAAIEVIPSRLSEASEPFDISKIDFERLRREFERSRVKRSAVQNLSQAIDNKLRRLMERNPLRTDFQRHYEDIVEAYNQDKDRPSIEKTFEELVRLVQELDEEESRAVREGLTEESLAIFDLLKKEELSAQERGRIKRVAKELLETLKGEKLRIDHWQEKESTRDAVRAEIRNFLWSDDTGLPVECYTEAEVQERAEEIFRHVYRAYPVVPSPFYEKTVAA